MTVEQARAVISERPRLHVGRGGRTKIGGLNRRIGERFIEAIGALERPRIVETGTGLSTLVFLGLDPGSVVSISPDEGLHERTNEEAKARGIDTSVLRFVCDRSESALPRLALDEQLEIDVGFIDGNHGWPAVFVDFCYLNAMLRRGGLLFVDDIQIYSVDRLVAFLRGQEADYEFLGIDLKMATFRKRHDRSFLPEWRMQPFLVANTATA